MTTKCTRSWYRLDNQTRLFYMFALFVTSYILIQDQAISSDFKDGSTNTHKKSLSMLHNNTEMKKSVLMKISPSYTIGVITSKTYLSTRATDGYSTWGKGHKHIRFFIGETNATVTSSLPVIVLKDATDLEYPPQSKGFRLLQYWCEHLLEQFDWFVKSDDDTYIKNLLLRRFLLTLDPKEKYYIGRAGKGIYTEVHKLGLYGNTFCCGPLVIYSRPLLTDLCPHLNSCLQNVTTPHEDTEIGRCVIFNLDLQCAKTNTTPTLTSLFYQNYEGDMYSRNLTYSKEFQPAITIHAVKESSLMFNLHYYYKTWLRRYKNQLQGNISAIYKKNPLGVRQLKAVYETLETKQP